MKTLFLFFALILINFGYGQDITEGLLLQYKFNENYQDASVNENHGTNHGTEFVEDRFGNEASAISFNGIDNFIEFPNLMTLKPGLPVSFSFWVKFDDEDYQFTSVFRTSYEDDRCSGVFFNTDASQHRYSISYGDGDYFYTPASRRTYVSTEQIETTEWHHVTAIVEGGTNMKLYIDCIEMGGTYNGTGSELEYSTTSGVLGRGDRFLDEQGDFFKGALDDFMYWNRAVTEVEVAELCTPNHMATNDFVIENKLILYPNPAPDFITINDDISTEFYAIYNPLGQRVLSGKLNSNKQILINNLEPGSYYLKLYGSKGNLTGKFLKK